MKSTFVIWNDKKFIQKSGICIGSCLAPILSDIYLAHPDRVVASKLDDSVVVKVCRFVDDFLILVDCAEEHFLDIGHKTVATFQSSLQPLQLTCEFPVSNSLRFLDLELSCYSSHLCWMYRPRNGKPLLPYSSAHSKLTKRSIANLCLASALKKSCPDTLQQF